MHHRHGIVAFIALFLLITPLALTPWIHGNDGVGYYAPLRSLIIDHNLDVSDEKEHYSKDFKIASLRQDPNTRRWYSQYPLGTALLWSPFFLIGHGIAWIGGSSMDGYTLPYVYLVCLGSALFGFIGLLFLYQLLSGWMKPLLAFLAILTMWLGTPLFYYMYLEPSMSHAASFFVASGVIYLWITTYRKKTTGHWALLGALLGLLFLIRYQEIIFLVLPLIEAFHEKFTKMKQYLLSALTFAIVISPQLLVLWINHRSILPSYGGGFSPGLVPSHLFQVLFSPLHGLFLWTPLLLFSALGCGLLWKDHRPLALAFIATFSLTLLLISGWSGWSAGQSFGHRMFLTVLPFFILCFGLLLAWLEQKMGLWIVAICAGFILWNTGLMLLYGSRMICSECPVPLSEMAGKMVQLPMKLGDITRVFFSRHS